MLRWECGEQLVEVRLESELILMTKLDLDVPVAQLPGCIPRCRLH